LRSGDCEFECESGTCICGCPKREDKILAEVDLPLPGIPTKATMNGLFWRRRRLRFVVVGSVGVYVVVSPFVE
jgi:hypothetical protein